MEELDDDQSSDAAAGDLTEEDIAEMEKLVPFEPETDPEVDEDPTEEMKEEEGTQIDQVEEVKQPLTLPSQTT